MCLFFSVSKTASECNAPLSFLFIHVFLKKNKKKQKTKKQKNKKTWYPEYLTATTNLQVEEKNKKEIVVCVGDQTEGSVELPSEWCV